MLASFFNIRPAERRLTKWLLVLALAMGAPSVFIETAAYTLFLGAFNAATLPYVYIGAALFTPLAGLLYTKFEKNLSFANLLTLNLFFLLACLGLFRLLLALSSGRWIMLALMIWADLSGTMTGLGFWHLAGSLLNVRQGKRLFGLIGAGFTLSRIMSGFSIPTLVYWAGAHNLLLIAIATFITALLVQTFIVRTFTGGQEESDEPDQFAEAQGQKAFAELIKNRYLVLIFALTILSSVAYLFLDNSFYDVVETRFTDANQLAGFIGLFSAVNGLLTLVLGAFFSGWLLNRYGLRVGILIAPVTVIVGAVLIILTATFTDALLIIFWLVVLTKLLDEALGMSVSQSIWQLLYQPLPPSQRLQAQTAVDSFVDPVSGGVAGILLLLLYQFIEVGAIQLIYPLLFVLIVWTAVGVALNRAYITALMQALSKRIWRDTSLLTVDSSSIAMLRQRLESPHVGVVVYSLNILQTVAPDSLPALLTGLLAHPVAEIRLEVLRRIEQLCLAAVLPYVYRQMQQETSVVVRGAALRALAVLGDLEVLDEVSTYLDAPEPLIRRDAMIGLLRSGEIEAIVAAGEVLTSLVKSPHPAQRAFAAQVLGESGISSFYRPLVSLLQDPSPQVQRAALIAAGKLRNFRVWPVVVTCLQSPQVRSTAVSTLVAGGEAALPAIGETFNQVDQKRDILIRLARACGRIGGNQAIDLLLTKIDHPDSQVRSHVLAALNLCGYQARDEAKDVIHKAINAEAAQATWIVATLVDLGEDDSLALLRSALHRTLEQHQARLLYLLSFIYNPASIKRVQATLSRTSGYYGRASAEKKAYALEVLDVTVAPELKAILLPLFDDIESSQRLQHLQEVFPQQNLDRVQRLQTIFCGAIEWLTPWTRATALHLMGQLNPAEAELVATVVSALEDPEPLIRETAVWALFNLDRTRLIPYVDRLSQDAAVTKALQYAIGQTKGGATMLSTIEKVIALKAVHFFSETPEDILAEIANMLEEVEVKAGQTVFHQGEDGSSMYIISSGRVLVHDAERQFDELGEGDVFGDMSLLDPAPRSASITATQDSLLLRLDQAPFYELLEDHSEISRRIIQLLTQRLRRAMGWSYLGQPLDELPG